MKRWEAPLPTSPACNARCLGCISFQDRQDLCATQDRITFVPTPDEICGVAVPHLKDAPRAVVSFGQGCEGEPLLQASVIGKSIAAMRKATGRGTVNLNTNGSLPAEVRKLCEAGLDSIRVSLNSSRRDYYNSYFRPKGYTFDDVKKSIKAVKANGGFASINYFVLPGFTDAESEFDALCRLVDETHLDFIQLRNLNADPEWVLREIGAPPGEKAMGVRQFMDRLKERFPELRFGYFNPCLDPALAPRP
jgi:molybdenum cofactor biosynthesis enzyme MoaA